MNFQIIKGRTREQQKKDFYKIIVARTDIHAALKANEQILPIVRETINGFKNDLYYPLFVAIVVCYSRPFLDNKPLGRLPNKWSRFDSSVLQKTHDDVIEARNSFIAHSDLKIREVKIVPDGTPLGDSKIISYGIGVQVRNIYWPAQVFSNIFSCCEDLLYRLNEEIETSKEKIYGNMDLPRTEFPIRFDNGL